MLEAKREMAIYILNRIDGYIYDLTGKTLFKNYVNTSIPSIFKDGTNYYDLEDIVVELLEDYSDCPVCSSEYAHIRKR